MAYRRILLSSTVLCALLLSGSLGLMAHARGERGEQPAQLERNRALASALERLQHRLEALGDAPDLVTARQARQDLAEVVLAFDQDLLAAAEAAGDRDAVAAVREVQSVWRHLGLGLADLAAGEYAANSAAGRDVIGSWRREAPTMRGHLQAMAAALHGAERQAGRLGRLAAIGAAVFGGLTLLCALAASRFGRAARTAPRAGAWAGAPGWPGADPAQTLEQSAPPVQAAAPAAAVGALRRAGPLAAHGDLGLASAAVDRVTLDMSTVARSAERMQQAVDSVASALQGMLFSLNELAQDTFEGSRLARTANNAAVYAAETARELLETAREMGTVVARVRTLAARSQEIAGRIEGEAAATGATGEAFTSVVAQEVKQLAATTSQATGCIEATVDEILAAQRQYEEAIGQIIKNIGAVRKVAANLGELMVAPPTRVQPGVGYAAAVAPPATAGTGLATAGVHPGAAASAPAAVAPSAPRDLDATAHDAAADLSAESPLAPEPDAEDTAEVFRSAEDLAAATSSLLDELAEVAAETNAKPAAAGGEPPAAEPAPQPAPEPEPPAAKPPVQATGANGNVFMLNRPKKSPPPAAESPQAVDPAPASAPPSEPPATPEPPAAAPPPADPTADASSPATPAADGASAAEAELEPAGAAAGPARPRPVAQGASGNIFMLNKPKK